MSSVVRLHCCRRVSWSAGGDPGGGVADAVACRPRRGESAHTWEQRLRAAQLMELLMEEESNVARCSAVEGIGLLASEEPSLRGVAEDMIARALREDTLAMKSRARHAKSRLEKALAPKVSRALLMFS